MKFDDPKQSPAVPPGAHVPAAPDPAPHPRLEDEMLAAALAIPEPPALAADRAHSAELAKSFPVPTPGAGGYPWPASPPGKDGGR